MNWKAAIVSVEANLAYVEDYLTEDEPLLNARREAAEVGGATPIGDAQEIKIVFALTGYIDSV